MEAMEVVNKLAGLSKEIHEVLQDPFFESLALTKLRRMEIKLEQPAFGCAGTVYLGAHLSTARALSAGRNYVHLKEDFLLDPPRDIPPGSVFLLLNNDVAKQLPQYMEFYNRQQDALFVIWDWDSQHWIQLSSILAMNSDFYCSATSENASLLGQFSPHVLGPVFVGVHQWPRRFLVEHMGLFMGERLNSPLGMHGFYGQYARRNRAIATVQAKFPTVGFANNDYKLRSELENFQEWSRHKSHWIVPVMAGVPIRVYNALVTGGIPILPAFYKNLPEIAILGDSPLYYEVADLLEPAMLVEAAVARFDAGGESGLVQRMTQAIAEHHIDTRCEQILVAMEQAVHRIRVRDRSHSEGYLGVRT